MTDDLLKRADPFLNVCASCDIGMPTSCTCPTGDYRPVMLELYREVERLRERYDRLLASNRRLVDQLHSLEGIEADRDRALGQLEDANRALLNGGPR